MFCVFLVLFYIDIYKTYLLIMCVAKSFCHCYQGYENKLLYCHKNDTLTSKRCFMNGSRSSSQNLRMVAWFSSPGCTISPSTLNTSFHSKCFSAYDSSTWSHMLSSIQFPNTDSWGRHGLMADSPIWRSPPSGAKYTL